MRTHFEQHLTHFLEPEERFTIQTYKTNPRRFLCTSMVITETGVTFQGQLYRKDVAVSYHPNSLTSLRLSYAEFAPLTILPQDGSHDSTHKELERLGIPEVFRYLIADQMRMLQGTHTMVSQA